MSASRAIRAALALLLAPAPLFAAADGVVRGRVVNGSGGALAEAVDVRLSSFGPAGGSWQAEDARAGFLFEGLPTGEEDPYLIHATYLGIVYNSQFHLHPGQDTTVVFEVYDTTSALAGIGIEGAEFDITLVEDRIRVDQVYRVKNESNPPKTILGNGSGTFQVSLPFPAAELPGLVLAASRGIMPVRREPLPTADAKIAAIDYPMRPGVTAVAASYELPYGGTFTYESIAPYDIPRLVLIAPGDMRIEGEKIAPAHGSPAGAGVFLAEAIPAGAVISFRTAGGTPAPAAGPRDGNGMDEGEHAGGEGRVVTVPAPFTEIRLPVLILVGAFLFGALALAWRSASEKKR